MKQVVKLLIVLVAFVGIMDAAYLSYEKLSGIIPPCHPGFQCSTVLTSKWSELFGIPLPLYGLAFYLTTIGFAIVNFLEVDHIKIGDKRLHTQDLMLALATFGGLFSLYLVTIMGIILQAWCLYCLVSALCCALLFLLNLWHWHLRKGECVDTCSRPRQVVIGLLYAYILKPIFFLFDAESIHNFMMETGRLLGETTFGQSLTAWAFKFEDKRLKRKIDGITFPNPVGLSAGFDYNGILPKILPAVGFGWHTIGTVTYRPYAGNPKPRLGRFPDSKALLVNKGFKSLGAEAVISHLEGEKFAIPTGISIGSTNAMYDALDDQIADVVACFKLFEVSRVKHAYYELNISCPNTQGGQPFTTPDRLEKLLKKLKTLNLKKPVYIKMPIDLTPREIGGLLKVAAGYKYISGVIFGNLTKDKTNPDVKPADRREWKKRAGNLSGKPTWNRSNALISYTKKKFGDRFTIVGTGGIFNGEDALVKMSLGADLVQLITGMIYEGPQVIGQINQQLANRQ